MRRVSSLRHVRSVPISCSLEMFKPVTSHWQCRLQLGLHPVLLGGGSSELPYSLSEKGQQRDTGLLPPSPLPVVETRCGLWDLEGAAGSPRGKSHQAGQQSPSSLQLLLLWTHPGLRAARGTGRRERTPGSSLHQKQQTVVWV